MEVTKSIGLTKSEEDFALQVVEESLVNDVQWTDLAGYIKEKLDMGTRATGLDLTIGGFGWNVFIMDDPYSWDYIIFSSKIIGIQRNETFFVLWK